MEVESKFNPCNAGYTKMERPLLMFSQLDYLIR